ncbi:MAG: hypothetical protein U9N49_04960 [Campylobacterota bacterium]|nr:hypothetical protein [Campylobacterota bacterium]
MKDAKIPYHNDYLEAIDDNIEKYYKIKNRVETKQNKSFLEMLNSEPTDFDKIKLKKNKEPLTKREKTLIKANVILTFNKAVMNNYRERIAMQYNITQNTPQLNQEILNNSYNVIIDELKKLASPQEVIELIEGEKRNNETLFTNGKKLSKLQSGNHYMSFLYQCNSVYVKDNDIVIFKEFVEALANGYAQYLEFQDSKTKVKQYQKDLEVLKRYNSQNENDANIQELEKQINFLSIAKAHQKIIPFKELANRLEIDHNGIINYINNATILNIHKNTIKQHFDTLPSIPKEICIDTF